MENDQTFTEVWQALSKPEKQALAEALDTSTNSLSQAAHGHFCVSSRFAKSIEQELGITGLFPVSKKTAA